jgi:hypothetical protein
MYVGLVPRRTGDEKMLAIREMILRRVLHDLLIQKGKNVVIDSGRGYDPENRTFYNLADLDEAVKFALEYDEVHIFLNGKGDNRRDGYGPYVYVIFGNDNYDLDMISDYATSLEPIIRPIMDWIERIEQGKVRLVTQDA